MKPRTMVVLAFTAATTAACSSGSHAPTFDTPRAERGSPSLVIDPCRYTQAMGQMRRANGICAVSTDATPPNPPRSRTIQAVKASAQQAVTKSLETAGDIPVALAAPLQWAMRGVRSPIVDSSIFVLSEFVWSKDAIKRAWHRDRKFEGSDKKRTIPLNEAVELKERATHPREARQFVNTKHGDGPFYRFSLE